MNRYVIEHRRIVPNVKVFPLIEVLGEVRARSAREASARFLENLQLDTDQEVIHVRRVS